MWLLEFPRHSALVVARCQDRQYLCNLEGWWNQPIHNFSRPNQAKWINLYAYALFVLPSHEIISCLFPQQGYTDFVLHIWLRLARKKSRPAHFSTSLHSVPWQVAVRLSVQDQNWNRNLFQTVLSALPHSAFTLIPSKHQDTPRYTKIHFLSIPSFERVCSKLCNYD